jgi:hypothetical protein
MTLSPFPVPKGSGSATCPEAQSTPPARRRLRCCHVPHVTERVTYQERALMLLRAPTHRVRHPPGEGSGVATCPEAPSPSPGRGRLRSCHMPCGSRPAPAQEGSPSDQDTRTIVWQGFGTTTCPVAPDPPPGAGGLQNRSVPSGSRP